MTGEIHKRLKEAKDFDEVLAVLEEAKSEFNSSPEKGPASIITAFYDCKIWFLKWFG